jgi:hypothetical protein
MTVCRMVEGYRPISTPRRHLTCFFANKPVTPSIIYELDNATISKLLEFAT